MKIVVVAMFKNESHVLKEWLDHYLREGVDTFLLIDNDSTDQYMPILEPYLRENKAFLLKSKKKNAQAELYNRWLPVAKTFDWVIVVDLDEFVYARNEFKTIKDYLGTVNKDIYKIQIPWKLFGSSGFKKQPNSVIQHFIHRRKYPSEATPTNLNERVVEVKAICRGPHLKKIRIHNSEVTNLHQHFSNNEDYKDVYFTLIDETSLNTHHLHLNHYRIQSWEFYNKVKMTRGDSAMKKYNQNLRTRKYFKMHDYKDSIDTELRDKKY